MDAADSTTITRSGANITQWNDKANNYSGPATNNPQYNSNPINSLPTIRFDGASNRYVLISANNYNYSFMTYFIVIRWISGSGGFMGTDTPSNYGRALAVNSPNIYLLLYSQFYTTSIPLTANQPCILSAYFNGTTNFTVILNGTPTVFAVGQGGGNTNTNGFNIGVFNPTNGGNHSFDMGEGIVYSSILNETQRQSIEGYLAQKWGLVSSLPANHPGRSQTFYTAGKNPGIAAMPSFTMTKVPYTNYFPLSIAGCTMWLDGADSSKVILNGSTVSQWTDKSAAGNNATQPTGGNQPSYSASGIVFAGNQWLITPIDVNPTAESFFIVFKTTNNLAEIFSGTNANAREVLIVGGVMYLSKYGTNPVGLTPNGGSVSTNTITLFDYQYTTSFVTLNLNGLQTGSGTPPVTYSGTGTSYIGSSTYATNNMYGTIYEIIYYNVSLTTNERQQVEGYLAWKWGITLTNTHPYYSAPPIEFGRPTQVAGLPLLKQITKILYLITNGLTNRWLFNEGSGTTFIDSVGGQNGNWTGSPAYVNVGSRSAIYLANTTPGNNSATQYGTTTGGQPASIFATTNWSLAVWMYPLTYLIEAADVFFGVGNYMDMYVGTASGQLAMYCNLTPSYGLGAAGTGVQKNVWSQITITCSNGAVTSYINGTLTTTGTYTTQTYVSSSISYIGAYQNTAFGVNMYLSDMRVYNRALTATEISQIVANSG